MRQIAGMTIGIPVFISAFNLIIRIEFPSAEFISFFAQFPPPFLLSIMEHFCACELENLMIDFKSIAHKKTKESTSFQARFNLLWWHLSS